MKRILFALVLFVTTSVANATCFNFNGQKYCPEEKEVAPVKQQQTVQRVCWLFGGKMYCPPTDGSQLVLPCESANALYERPIPVIPVLSAAPTTQVVGVIAPTDARGRPMPAAEICSQYGCTGANTPTPIVQYQSYQPQTAVWVQEPPKACAKIIVWGPQLGTGPWGLPSGPPLHRRK